ncbi:MAG: T9SS type A sorting domain-containing protein, partial [Candidatus Marinimicrobia bacterium]|nr:T9SS type A sorting domain-containing protein [Candidatus Neomarinimicrobiota bacterium]
DNGLGKQGVSKIITAANIFETIFIDSSTMGEYGVWNEIIYTIETDASVVILETPSNFNIIGGDKEITLQWSSVSNSDFKHYTIYGGTDRNNLTIKKTISDISAKSLFISSLTNGEEYYYCISQTDLTGKESVRSFVLSIVPLSLDIADFSIGVLQNPIYTENIDVYVTSNSDMEDWTVELFYQWNESISEIKLENINGKVFQNTAFTLSKAGNYELTANGKRLNAVYSGYDTLRFSSQLLKAGQRLSIQSTDKRLKLDVSGDRSENAYWLTIFNKSMNQIQSSDAFECLNKLYQIGLDSKKISGQMMFNIEDETDPRSLFIAKKEGDCFKILKTNYDSKEKVLLASMSEAGSYFIAKSKAGIQNFDGLQPKYFELKQNYPNPFNPSTTLEFSLIETDHITLEIYNMLGQKIKTIVSAQHFPGNYSYIWNGLNHSGVQVASGLYFYRIRGNNVQDIKKMVLTR